MSDPSHTPKARDLPDDVRRIVDEIENEIGDDGFEGLITSAAEVAAPPRVRPSKRGRTPVNGGIESAVRQILSEIGEDPSREGLVATPDRVHRMYHELTAGY